MTEKAKIYPVELMLNVENQDDNHATFLDIEVNVEGDQFKTKTYDKRENYKFEIYLVIFHMEQHTVFIHHKLLDMPGYVAKQMISKRE